VIFRLSSPVLVLVGNPVNAVEFNKSHGNQDALHTKMIALVYQAGESFPIALISNCSIVAKYLNLTFFLLNL
jgi:hypothetical protein